MVVSRVTSLTNRGIFRNYRWPADLDEFGRYNLIYGWNGTGKTTLSRVFQDLELRNQLSPDTVRLSVDGSLIDGVSFRDSELPVRVFNRNLIDETILPLDGAEAPPILVFGKESVEKQKEVNRLKLQLDESKSELQKYQDKNRATDKELDKHCIDSARAIKRHLQSVRTTYYTYYNKRRYRTSADRILKSGNIDDHLLNSADQTRYTRLIGTSLKPPAVPLTAQPCDLNKLIISAGRILLRSVTTPGRLLSKGSEITTWLHKGLQICQGGSFEACPFCEQELPKHRIDFLEREFSNEFQELQIMIDESIKAINKALISIDQVIEYDHSRLYDEVANEWDSLKGSAVRSKALLYTLIEDLEAKRFNVSVPMKPQDSLAQIDTVLFDSAITLIDEHNEKSRRFETLVSEAGRKLEEHFVTESIRKYGTLRNTKASLDSLIDSFDSKIKSLSSQISRLERDILEYRRPADELNEELSNYLGHSELSLSAQATGYGLTRNGIPVRVLSEGERSAIALLYFLKSLTDQRFSLEQGIVVLDDPVSSLDTQSLFLALSFIRNRTEGVGQLFILTHNFSFFRQVQMWFRSLANRRTNNTVRYYMLGCYQDQGVRTSRLERLDPLLAKYHSEYHYLFARVFRAVESRHIAGLEDYYGLPNIARRLLETFLAFRYPHESGGLTQTLHVVPFDEVKKLRILRFVHSHSHSDAIGESIHNPSLLGEAQAVLIDLLDLLKHLDEGHYNGMKRLVERVADS